MEWWISARLEVTVRAGEKAGAHRREANRRSRLAPAVAPSCVCEREQNESCQDKNDVLGAARHGSMGREVYLDYYNDSPTRAELLLW